LVIVKLFFSNAQIERDDYFLQGKEKFGIKKETRNAFLQNGTKINDDEKVRLLKMICSSYCTVSAPLCL